MPMFLCGAYLDSHLLLKKSHLGIGDGDHPVVSRVSEMDCGVKLLCQVDIMGFHRLGMRAVVTGRMERKLDCMLHPFGPRLMKRLRGNDSLAFSVGGVPFDRRVMGIHAGSIKATPIVG